MASLTICLCATLIVFQATMCFAQFPEQREFTPTVIPRDPSQARQLLGYNKYDRTEVKNTNKQVLYGNNWEQFDTPSNDNYNANQYYHS